MPSNNQLLDLRGSGAVPFLDSTNGAVFPTNHSIQAWCGPTLHHLLMEFMLPTSHPDCLECLGHHHKCWTQSCPYNPTMLGLHHRWTIPCGTTHKPFLENLLRLRAFITQSLLGACGFQATLCIRWTLSHRTCSHNLEGILWISLLILRMLGFSVLIRGAWFFQEEATWFRSLAHMRLQMKEWEAEEAKVVLIQWTTRSSMSLILTA